MRDMNDPQLLGETILATQDELKCSIAQAADHVYTSMHTSGWHCMRLDTSVLLSSPGVDGPVPAPGSPSKPAAQKGRQGEHNPAEPGMMF